MDDTLLFMPPCCVDKKLPKAVMQAPYRSLTFYTHGDVTMEKMYRAVSHLVVDRHVMVLAMPTVSNETAAFLQQCFERKWITDLVISSATIRMDLVIERYLSEYQQHILFVTDKKVTVQASHMTLYSDRQALMITGPMLACASNTTRLMAYHAQFSSSFALYSDNNDWGNPIRNTVLPDVLRMRSVYFKSINKIPSERLRNFLLMNFTATKDE